MRHPSFRRTAVLVLLLGALVIPAASAQDSTALPQSGEGSVQPRVPSNDDFADAWPVGTSNWDQSTAGATTEASEWLGPCEGYSFGATVWYVLTVTQPSTVTVDTVGSDYDTILTIYSGTTSATYVTCDDDTNGVTSQAQFTAVPGTNYWIQIGGYNATTGHLYLNVAQTPIGPSNDGFAGAWSLGSSQAQDTSGATTQAGEPLTCGQSNMGATVWYKTTYAEQTAGLFTVDTRGSDFDTMLAVYRGSTVGSLTQVTCNDDISPTDLDSELQFTAQPWVQYWIQVGGYGGETGNLQLHASWTQAGYFCRGRPATHVGTDGNDILYGTDENDVIVALGGNDTIYGYGGKDYICAGTGRDMVYGGPGNDRILGDAGHDQLHGQSGNDRIFGRLGDDVIFGEMGDDRLRGNGGYDTLRGDLGYDQCKTGEDVICELVLG